MTISSATRKAGPFLGNGVTTSFPFTFKVFQPSDIQVAKTTVAGIDIVLLLNSDYSIALNADQNANPGGTITHPLSGTLLQTGEKLTATGVLGALQSTHITNGGNFFANNIEDQMDYLTILVQQLIEQMARVALASSSDLNPVLSIGTAVQRALKYLTFDASGNISLAQTLPSGTLSAGSILSFLVGQADGIGAITNPVLTVETSLGIVPTNPGYPAYPYVDPRRYGADPTGVVVSTTAVQNAINVAYALKGTVWIGHNCNYLCGALSLTVTGNRLTEGLTIRGSSPNGSRITQSGAPAALLTFTGSTPTTNPTEANLVLEGFTICQAALAKTADGIVLNSIANFRITNVIARGFNAAVHLKSSLIGTLDQGSQFTDSNYGVLIEGNGVGGSTCNLISIHQCKLNLNSTFGLWYENGSQLLSRDNDLEGNGTPGNVNSGAIRIRGNLSPVSLEASVLLDHNWLEGNFGQGILIDAPTGGVTTDIAINGGEILAQEAGRSITCNGASRLRIGNLICGTPGAIGTGDTFALTAGQALIENILVTNLSDAGITTPTYINVNTSAGLQANGRVTTFTGTLTGVTASGTTTGTVTAIQQGKTVRLIFPSIFGVSTTTAATITGLPASLIPSIDRNVSCSMLDNGINFIGTLTVGASGVITLAKPGTTFTATGNKGLSATTLAAYDL